MPLRPWNQVPIRERDEPLVPLPAPLLRLEPHPYQALGAPYGTGLDPFRLREGVLERLMQAQVLLRGCGEDWQLAIFDAWRPLAVQHFMVEYTFRSECRRRGLDPDDSDPCQEVRELVGKFWAAPSDDPNTPPPHSTGAAVDLTLAEAGGSLLAMGGEIDALGPESAPDHYALEVGGAALWHRRRQILRGVMEAAGFVQHPNEWWHFSHGDQLWAWRSGADSAIYGRVGC